MSVIVPISLMFAGGLCFAAGVGVWVVLRRYVRAWVSV